MLHIFCYIYIMATSGQMPEAGELRPDQLEIGKVYRIVQYGRRKHGAPHQLIDQSLGRFKTIWGVGSPFMTFTIVAPGTSPWRTGRTIDIVVNTSPTQNYHYRFFQTAEDRLVNPLKQKALNQVFNPMGESTAHGLSDGWFAPNKKPRTNLGGRKYKTRQTKVRRQNRTKKNRRRTYN